MLHIVTAHKGCLPDNILLSLTISPFLPYAQPYLGVLKKRVFQQPARDLFLNAICQLKEAKNESILGFLKATQKDVLSLDGMEKQYKTPDLGNALRKTAEDYRKQMDSKTSSIIEPVRKFLFEVISKSDKEILTTSRRLSGS